MQKLGMVIINYNDYSTTKKLLENIVDYSCLDKIVVVDNCSTDDSFKKLKKLKYKKVEVIKSEENKGYAAGMNLGSSYLIKTLGKCHIIFSNADVIIQNEKDLLLLSSDITTEIGVVGPVILEHGTFNRGWKKTNVWIEVSLNLPLINRYFKKKFLYYKDNHYQTALSFVDVISGCFFMVDSTLLQNVDYFDEGTFLYYEELIFACKVQNAKKRVLVDNRVSIVHDHSVTVDKSVSRIRKYRILKTSQRYYVEKYLQANTLELFFILLKNKLYLGVLYIRGLFHR